LNAGLDVRPLRDLDIRLAPTTAAPGSPAAAVFSTTIDQTGSYAWFSPTLSCHTACVTYQPLYFEEINLERYGYGFGCLQPFVSAAHFYGTLPLLPYKMAASPPCSCEVNLQYPPAATAAPPVPLCHRRFSVRGAVIEAAVVAGAILLFP
jgi:hypothetical protein